ncbi:hypothetical protein AAG570_004337 [Ranatra chinensis]|uniref:Uncharacterized protein n=1 Tax=Ranatra chinensis TaxID=642074 RepID=A0ABD0Y0K1_9HEMI
MGRAVLFLVVLATLAACGESKPSNVNRWFRSRNVKDLMEELTELRNRFVVVCEEVKHLSHEAQALRDKCTPGDGEELSSLILEGDVLKVTEIPVWIVNWRLREIIAVVTASECRQPQR